MNFEEFKEKIEKVRSAPIEIIDRENIPAEEISDFDKLPKSPDISVLTITYNHSPFIRQYLESVLNQKFDGTYEIVIGEDCSTDDTRDILIEYQKKYPEKIRIVYSEKNVGGRRNLLRTLKKCRGKYIALIEGDDFWHSELKLAKQFAYMEAHPECSTIYSDSDQLIMKTGKIKRNIMQHDGCLQCEFTAKKLLTSRYLLNTCTCFSRAEILRKILLTSPMFTIKLMLGDLALRVELARYGKIAILPESLGTYRVNVPGHSACRFADHVKEFDFHIDIWLISFYYGKKIFSEDCFRIFNFSCAEWVSGFLSSIYLPETVKKFRIALRDLNIVPSVKIKIYLAMGEYRLLNWAGKIFRKLKGL